MTMWIESGGGPLIMFPSATAGRWRGGFGAGEAAAAAPEAAADYDDTDYGWACAVHDLIAVGQLYGHEAIVFGDLSLPTTWQTVSTREGVVARLDWTDQGDDVLDAMVLGLRSVGNRALSDQQGTIDLIVRDLHEADPSVHENELASDGLANSLKQWVVGPSANLTVRLTGGEYVIFDSAYEGSDPGSVVRVALEPGTYQIKSGFYRPQPGTCFRLHWFRSDAFA